MSVTDPYEFDDLGSSGRESVAIMTKTRFQYGDVVVAKVGKYPYWPAMVDIDPDTNEFCWGPHEDRTIDTTHFNVVFFDGRGKVTRSWVVTSKIDEYHRHFPNSLTERDIERANLQNNKKEKELVDARILAEDALKLDVEARAEKYSFINTYKGKITLFDKLGKPMKKHVKPGRPKRRSSGSADGLLQTLPTRSSRQSIATSEPSRAELEADERPARNPEPLPESSLKLKITKDKNGGKYSSKISVSRASNELSEQLSDFATSFPPTPETTVSVEMPKKRGRKRKSQPKKKKPAKKSVTASVASVSVDSPASPVTTVPASSPTSPLPGPSTSTATSAGSLASPTPGAVQRSTQQDQRQVGIALPFQQVPEEETLANRMNDVIVRMQSQQQLPARLQTNRTVSNVGLVVDPDPTIDLTGDDEPEQVPWEQGEVVLAHLNGFQPWPAVIDGDPDNDNKYLVPSNGAPTELVHVVFLELDKRVWVNVQNVTKYTQKKASTLSVFSHKLAYAVEKANKAVKLSTTERIRAFGTQSFRRRTISEDDIVVLD